MISCLLLVLRTLRYLRCRQVVYQLWYRLRPAHPLGYYLRRASTTGVCGKPLQACLSIPKEESWERGSTPSFCFVHIKSLFSGWNDLSHGALWCYNLNYMDYLGQSSMTYEEGAEWIERFIENVESITLGLDPYPISLRAINWVKFISAHNDKIPTETKIRWDSYLYAQILRLRDRLEYHLLGNHLLENAYALYITSLYFADAKLWEEATSLLLTELKEQVLSDGAHYELSPMYHTILLDRLLDCYNFSVHNLRFSDQKPVESELKRYVIMMLGHLHSIVYRDKTIPLFNDSAYGIAPSYTDLYAYATRLGIEAEPIPMAHSGYRWLRASEIEMLVDIGNVMASYQPGHTHADTLSYELRLRGVPIVVDTGISTYNKTARREYERSTIAHNTVVLGGASSSEVWSSFRLGRRARVTVSLDGPTEVEASHDGYGSVRHTRHFILVDDGIQITDSLHPRTSQAISYIHLAPEERLLCVTNHEVQTTHATITIVGAEMVIVEPRQIARYYNTLESSNCLCLYFTQQVQYIITFRK